MPRGQPAPPVSSGLGRHDEAGSHVVDRSTLLDAQRNPEKYRNLAVRVAGYSAYFVQIGKDMQDEVIRRTEHHAV